MPKMRLPVVLAAALTIVGCAEHPAADSLARAAALQQERARLGCAAETLGCQSTRSLAAAGLGK